MSVAIYGKATVAGVGADGSAVYTGVAATFQQQVTGLSLTSDSTVEENMDGNGESVGACVANRKPKLKIDFYPVAVTGTNTKANALAAMVLPPDWSLVTLSTFDEGVAGQINGDWIYPGGGDISRDKGQCKMSLPLERRTTSAKTAAQLTTAVV